MIQDHHIIEERGEVIGYWGLSHRLGVCECVSVCVGGC